MMNNNMHQEKIALLSIACRYWEMAKSCFGSPSAKSYYDKAYTIFCKEMGPNYPITLELLGEMKACKFKYQLKTKK